MDELDSSIKDIGYVSNSKFLHFLTAETLTKYILQFGVNKDRDYAFFILVITLTFVIFLLVIVTSIIAIIQYANESSKNESVVSLNYRQDNKYMEYYQDLTNRIAEISRKDDSVDKDNEKECHSDDHSDDKRIH
ncbi:unnamed protein product [Dimorphilus gyrociliatus]|uniref:Uncharacterized protein n=1 Tax=Dimorphilus gyrociliatus TaxID=2664684 RepID=A0A7I8W5V1_9ANNE|nr:unnamed protein product [Dimorphilus gyrociliatus]